MIRQFILFVLIVASLSSCNEKTVIIPPFEAPVSDRVILLEELTGVSCQNCPKGAATAQGLATSVFPGQVVVVAVHGGFLSDPLSQSQFDFRNDDAEELEDYLKPWLGKPAATINRIQFDTESNFGIDDPDKWQGYVADVLERPHVMELQLASEFNENTRELTVNVGAIPLEDMTGNFRVTVMLTEGGIIDAQLDGAVIIDDYEHNHVLRDIITEVEGTSLATSLTKNEVLNRTYTSIVDPSWDVDHMYVVAAVANVDGGKEVLQAAEIHLN